MRFLKASYLGFVKGLFSLIFTFCCAFAVQAQTDSTSFSWGGSVALGASSMNQVQAAGQAIGSVHYFKQKGRFQFNLNSFGGYYALGEVQSNFLNTLNVLPGLGRVIDLGGNSQVLAGNLEVSLKSNLGKHVDLELGNGRNHEGFGYRSLVFSNFSSSLPYLKLNTHFGKIRFTNFYTRTHHLAFNTSSQAWDLQPKYTAIQTLSYKINKQWEVQVNDMVVWQVKDSLNHRELDLHYLNPFLFYRPVEYAQGSADNALVGASLKYQPFNNFGVYGQLLLDEFLMHEILNHKNGWWGNKYGALLGLKGYSKKCAGLTYLSEWSFVRPFTYTHGSPTQAWGHMNQAYAHPLGANFYEWLMQLGYAKNKWTLNAQFIWAAYGRDQSHNVGGNIFQSYKSPWSWYSNQILQGNRSTLLLLNADLGWALSDQWTVFANARIRLEDQQQLNVNQSWLMLGIRKGINALPKWDF